MTYLELVIERDEAIHSFDGRLKVVCHEFGELS